MAGRLQRELKKRRPFDSVSQEAHLGLSRTADRLQIHVSRLLRGHGLTPQQYNILRVLRGAGEPLPILEVAQRLVTVVPGITGLIDRLEEAGLVQRRRCTADRRVVFAAITPRGLELLAGLDQPVLDLHRRLLRGLTAAEQQTLIDLLDKLRAGLPDEQ